MRVSIFHGLSARDKLSIILLFVSIALNFLNPWIPVAAILFVTILKARQIDINGMILFLSFTWLLFDFIGLSNGNVSFQMAIYLAVPSILFFNLGNIWVKHFSTSSFFFIAMTSIIIALALPHIVVTLYDITQVGLVNPDRWLSVLNEDAQRSVTQRTVEISLSIGSIGLLFHRGEGSTETKNITKVLLAISVLAIICSLHYVSRTGVVIMLVSILLGVTLKWKFSVKTFFFIIFAFLIYLWIDSTELFSVYLARETAESNMANVGLRLPRWEWAWKTTFNNPWGTANFMSAEHPYAHNFWLDIGKNCGVIPFFMMILFSLNHLINVWRIIRKDDTILKVVVVLWTATCYMSLMTEPIHEGAPAFMFIYFFFCGMCYRMARCNIINK